jgi:hypothetical protein
METYLNSAIKRFEYYKTLGEKTFGQVSDDGLFWQYNAESNSIAVIVQHIAGNMISRWTDFFTTDGEKASRNRDEEFEHVISTRGELLDKWNEGWDCMFDALNSITATNWEKTIYIRNEPHTIVDAINRQLAHIPYHIGQIVFIGKMIAGEKWNSLSIPKGKSSEFNSEKFAKHGNK